MTKKFLVTIFVFGLLGVFIISCNNREEEILLSEETPLITNKETETLSKLKQRYGIKDIQEIKNNVHIIKYEDGREIRIKTIDENKFAVVGKNIGVMEIKKDINTEIGYSFERKNDLFAKNIVKTMGLDYGEITTMSPCGSHPSGESFNDCVAREWSEFCDGVIGCAAQVVNPMFVLVAIAIHCGAC